MKLNELLNRKSELLNTEIKLEGYLTEGRSKHSSFLFFDLREVMAEHDNIIEPKIQIVLKESLIDNFKEFRKTVSVGDYVEVTGILKSVSEGRPQDIEVLVTDLKKVVSE